MKKIVSLLLVFAFVFSFSACGNETVNVKCSSCSEIFSDEYDFCPKCGTSVLDISDGDADSMEIETDEPESQHTDINISSADTVVELSEYVTKDVKHTISALSTEWDGLKSEINTYDKYIENVKKIEKFYEKLETETEQLCIRLSEYSVAYAGRILASDKSYDDKYDDLDAIYDDIYENACDEIYDQIYDGILDDMYDTFYDGILNDAYDNAPYDEWSEACSKEYDVWSNSCSEVYGFWSDASSDIYSFYSDLQGDVYSNDMKEAKKTLTDFKDRNRS